MRQSKYGNQYWEVKSMIQNPFIPNDQVEKDSWETCLNSFSLSQSDMSVVQSEGEKV